MVERLISGEVEPQHGQATRAAKVLQQLGFRVLHIGPTISVQGTRRIWEEAFAISFTEQQKRISVETGVEATFLRPREDPVPIPAELRPLIVSVVVVEPPEWFGGSG